LSGPHDHHTPQSSYTKEELLVSGQGKLFGPGNAQLPTPPMLMMDRITEITLDGGEYGKGNVVGEFDINPDLWFFECHFPGDPVMPGCLYWLGWSGSPGKGRALGVGDVRFTGEITPDIKLVRYEIDIRRVRRGRLVLGIADGRVFADGEKIYTAKDMRVGLVEKG